MIMYKAEPIRDSQGNQWSKTELKCWRSARQPFQGHDVIPKNFSTSERRRLYLVHTEVNCFTRNSGSAKGVKSAWNHDACRRAAPGLHRSSGAVWESTEIWECSHNWKSLTRVKWEVFAKKDNIKWVLSIKSQGTVFTFPLQGQTLGRCYK